MDINIRKCRKCGKDIDISKSEFIKFQSGFYHAQCFIDRQMGKKNGAWTLEQCQEELYKFQESEAKQVHDKFVKDSLVEFLTNQYNISFFPNYFYIKMQSVYNGTYKGLTRPVNPEHLLEMWQTKMNYLNKVNAKKSKPLEGINRIYYDLAILLSRYDKFLEWKESQKYEYDKIAERMKESKNQINYQNIIHSLSTQEKKPNIDDVLDEI